MLLEGGSDDAQTLLAAQVAPASAPQPTTFASDRRTAMQFLGRGGAKRGCLALASPWSAIEQG